MRPSCLTHVCVTYFYAATKLLGWFLHCFGIFPLRQRVLLTLPNIKKFLPCTCHSFLCCYQVARVLSSLIRYHFLILRNYVFLSYPCMWSLFRCCYQVVISSLIRYLPPPYNRTFLVTLPDIKKFLFAKPTSVWPILK